MWRNDKRTCWEELAFIFVHKETKNLALFACLCCFVDCVLHFSPVPRAAQRCSGITQPWGSISTPTDPACTSAPSAARRLSRAPNSNVTNSFTRGRNPFRLASGRTSHYPTRTDTSALFLHFRHISTSSSGERDEKSLLGFKMYHPPSFKRQ